MTHVVALGALNIDLVQVADHKVGSGMADDCEHTATVEEIQESIMGRNRKYEPFLGGSAFNTITMMAQLKRDNLQLGMIGVSTSFSYGAAETHRDRLNRLRIDDKTYHSSGAPGLCVSEPNPNGRRLRTTPQANLEIVDYLQNPKVLLYACSADILHVTSFLEDPVMGGYSAVADVVASFVKRARQLNPRLILSLDPGDVWVKLRHAESLKYLYRQADLMFVNSHEFEELAGTEIEATYEAQPIRSSGPDRTTIILKYPDKILIKRSIGFDLVRLSRRSTNSVVDTTGAGDAISAGVLTALAECRSLAEGCALGMRIALERVSDYGDLGHRNLLERIGHVWDPSENANSLGWSAGTSLSHYSQGFA